MATRDEIAAQVFPKEWAAASTARGERARRQRHNLRRRAEITLRINELRAHGASCATCRYLSSGPPGIKGPVCDANSDFHGYALTKPENLCADWISRRPPIQGQAR